MTFLKQWRQRRDEPEAPAATRAVFDAAIRTQQGQYRELRQAAAAMLYLRNKLAADLKRQRHEAARDPSFRVDVERAARQLGNVTAEAEAAKRTLLKRRNAMRALEAEKVRALALLSTARAKQRVRTAQQSRTEETERSLEQIRAQMEQIAAEEGLDRELGL